ncbi:hypothetical protein KKQ10_10640 [Pseudomonas sp. MG-9]|uniref:Uncharacterized protein n=1 Tax=Pseudomonas serboccidentalis TaxID=2964670 RepID=A0ABY7ZFB0_9PSED|nr:MULTISPECIES: hypothetical protein [Pseudomonas]MBT9265339.1 hypothetical protein [Pseudomonas sp. MG-9]WDR38215.1 hypothetical protein NN484_10900 [Pseudomonas serboccidentalis]
MLNDDETHQSVEHTLTEIDHAPQSSDAPEESVALATREREVSGSAKTVHTQQVN